MKRLVLIDGDVFAFQAASAIEEEVEWEDGFFTWHTDADAVKALLLRKIAECIEAVDADEAVVCFSDPSANWRVDVFPAYKGHRKDKKPLALKHVKQWMVDDHDAKMVPTMEGDDLLGVLATMPTFKPRFEKLVVSLDKDLKTIPGLYCRDPFAKDMEIVEISEQDADEWHLIQTLAGDPTDGYPGCPGIGMSKATKFVKGCIGVEAHEHVLKRGPRKGETELRFTEVPMDDPWEAVVSHYNAAGLTEEDALVQARVARICRHTDFDNKRKEPILWTPTKP